MKRPDPPGDEIAKIAACLLGGGIALLPTDTVYGLAVHPAFPESVERLFLLKQRSRSRQLPVMIASEDELAGLGVRVTETAGRLLRSSLVPGALTFVLGFMVLYPIGAVLVNSLLPSSTGRPSTADQKAASFSTSSQSKVMLPILAAMASSLVRGEDRRTGDRCPQAGFAGDLARPWPARRTWGVARSFQQLEVRLMTARRVQHDLHQARCGCGKADAAGRPDGVPTQRCRSARACAPWPSTWSPSSTCPSSGARS